MKYYTGGDQVLERALDILFFFLFLVVWVMVFCLFLPLRMIDFLEDRKRRRVPR